MEVKDRIAGKAEELFLQFGIRSVTMDDIANSLGMSKKTLYLYYADKDELVDAVVDGHIRKIQTDCVNCRREARDAVHEIFITIEQIMAEFNNMNPMVLFDLEKFHFQSYRRFREHKEKFMLQIIRDNLEWGVKEELYRDDLDVEVLSRFRIESMMIPFNVSVFPPGKYNLASLSEEIILHFAYGLATVKGHKLIQKYHHQRLKKT